MFKFYEVPFFALECYNSTKHGQKPCAGDHKDEK